MALQLGALRDALIDAGAAPEKATEPPRSWQDTMPSSQTCERSTVVNSPPSDPTCACCPAGQPGHRHAADAWRAQPVASGARRRQGWRVRLRRWRHERRVVTALQLGALRDALIEAGATDANAKAAAEEVAGYENRLIRLKTMVQAMIAIGMLLLASQGAIWPEIGKLDGKVDQTGTRIDQVNAKVDQLIARIDQIGVKIDQLSRNTSARP
jgi:hypothetical protein